MTRPLTDEDFNEWYREEHEEPDEDEEIPEFDPDY